MKHRSSWHLPNQRHEDRYAGVSWNLNTNSECNARIQLPHKRKDCFRRTPFIAAFCKRRCIGFHLHHIDGNSSNTVDENLAVLCVEDHDRHHRPNEYESRVNHLE